MSVRESEPFLFYLFYIPTSIGRRASGVMYSAERYLTPAYFSIFPFSLPLSIVSLCHRVAKMKICIKSASVTNDRGPRLLFCIGVQQFSLSFVSQVCSVFGWAFMLANSGAVRKALIYILILRMRA